MAITPRKKPAEAAAPAVSDAAMAFIEQGGAPTAKADAATKPPTPAEVVFTLRLPADLAPLVEHARKSKPDKVSRNAWIVGAIRLRLQAEGGLPKDGGTED